MNASSPAPAGPCGPVPDEIVAAVDRATAQVLGPDARLGGGQRDAVLGVLGAGEEQQHAALAVLPPAAGKTAIYAIAGLVLGGPTVVVSPTLSLHHDQVEHLRAAGLTAEVLNSTLAGTAHAAALERIGRGEVAFCVTSPEQLARPDVLDALAAAGPTLLAVDEVHCVCDWGPDFRPDYLALAAVRRRLGPSVAREERTTAAMPRLLGLTATASEPARADILELLGAPDACVVVRDVDRPLTHLAGRVLHDEDAKWSALVTMVTELDGAGIVYVTTRGHTTLVRDRLRAAGVDARAYHGGGARAERARVQDAFMAGDVRVVVATSAFGMGIDKPDVRWVLHGDTPTSVDAYHQEIGRAGRDGGAARAVLFHRPQDLARPKLFASGRDASTTKLRTVLEAVRLHPDDGVTEADLADAAGLSRAALGRAVPALVALGAVRRLSGRRLAAPPDDDRHVRELARDAAAIIAHRRERDRSRVELVRRYAEGLGCRRRTLLEVLGESRTDACGSCDHCDAGDPGDPGDRAGIDAGDPAPGERVTHPRWGAGVVQTVAEGSVVVLFDEAGYRTLSLEVVRARDLLAPQSRGADR